MTPLPAADVSLLEDDARASLGMDGRVDLVSSPPDEVGDGTPAPVRARGRFVKGEPGPALRHGQFSRLVRSGEATGTANELAAMRQQLRSEQDQSTLGIVKSGLIDLYIETRAVRTYLGGELQKLGPLTAKGNQRAMLTAFLAVSDREMKLSAAIGHDVAEKRVPSARELLMGVTS